MAKAVQFKFREVQHPVIGRCLAITFPYDVAVKDAFKAVFANRKAYEWDGASKAWFCRITQSDLNSIVRDLNRTLGGLYLVTAVFTSTLLPHLPHPPQAQGAPPTPPSFPGGKQAAPPPPQPDAQFFKRKYATADDWAALWLIEGAPPEVVKAVYRALALVYHPDRGGQPGDLQRVTVAYGRLEAAGALTKVSA